MTTDQSDLTARFGTAPDIGARASSPTIDLMVRHRSCRAFTDDEVSDRAVRTLLAAALSAPSKSDLQQVSVLWLTDPEQRRAVLDLSPRNDWALAAPQVLVFCADGRRIRRAADRLDRPFPNNHLDQFMNAAVDCGIVLGAAITAAEALGLGACPISELRDEAGRLIELLELPAFVVPVAGLALGRPADPDRPVTPRLPLDVTVHQNRYSDEAFDAAFEEYERRRESHDPRRDEEQRAVDRFGVAHPYGWAEDRTRQYSVPRRADWGSHVQGQGFGLE
jgi:nitroreductase